jgi:general secretion pathway protein G
MKKGFTLIETLIVATMIGILVVILIPQYKYSVIRAREAVLKEDLFQMRDAISKFFYDKKKYPASLEDLVAYRYLRKMPEDPFIHTAAWEPVYTEPIEGEEYDPETAQGIIDVRSLNQGTALDGTKYADW